MRILLIADNYPPETNAGAARASEHARHWVRRGHQVTVITCVPNFPQGKVYPGYRNRPRQVEEREGVRVVRVMTFMAPNRGVVLRTLDFLSFMAAAWVAGLFERRPDVIIGTSPQFFAAVAGWALAVVKRVPFVFELRDLWPASIKAVGAVRAPGVLNLVERLELFLYRRAAAVLAVTDAFRENLVSRGIPAGKVVVVKAGADLSAFSPRPRDEALAQQLELEDGFVVGYIGTHGMAHGLSVVLEAAQRLQGQSGARFLLVGDGAERAQLLERRDTLGLDNVVMVPPQPKERVQAYWSLCDMALVCLRDDPVFAQVLPTKLFEAMAMGLPVLVSLPRGETTQLVESLGCGVCVPPGDAEALADAVKALEGDPERVASLAARAAEHAPRFDRRQGAERIEAMLQRLVERKPPNEQEAA